MNKKTTLVLAFAILASMPCITAAADTPELLTGTPIGSPSVDYASGTVSQTANTPECAFDEDLNTFYASYDAQYAWVGLDLGSPHVISRVSFVPAVGQRDRSPSRSVSKWLSM